MLFITVRSGSPADVPKVLQVVEHVKRLRHKRGELTMSIPLVSRFTPYLPPHLPDYFCRGQRGEAIRGTAPIRDI
jgi:hypothetical protein